MNPFINETKQPYNSVPFELIKSNHFIPAIDHFIKVTYTNIEDICNVNNPSFENTILAFESSAEELDYVVNVFHHLFGSEADDEIKSLINKINPIVTKLYNDVYLNEKLFSKIEQIFNDINLYSGDDARLINEVYTSFLRSGSKLNIEDKKRYRAISQELAKLNPQFSNNVLSATNEINDYWISDEDNLIDLPESKVASAKQKAIDNEKPNKWCFSLDTDFFILMKFCKNSSIRKEIMFKTQSRCNGGKYDNTQILQTISKLRHERANLLGFNTHADYVLDRRMAKNKTTVYNFINDLLMPSFECGKKEIDDIASYALKNHEHKNLESYDLLYYAEKYKQHTFDFNDEILRPYFKSENVINGAFSVAEKLYGLKFTKLDNIQTYHPEVIVYEVQDGNNEFVGLLYQDIHPRKTKRGGAWMNQLRSQGYYKGKTQEPHVTFNCNLTRSSKDTPALLSISEVRTIFHEFGHCLHGLLTNVKYQSLGAMSVYWDFVELPSQILENWLSEPEVLDMFAKHFQTGEKIPKDYINKINESKKFMSGLNSLRQLHLCKIDMSWHDGFKERDNIEKHEKELLDQYTLLPKMNGVAVSPAFSHIFSGGYSSGYYSYKWAELLEADAYSKFKEDGIFNKETAKSFKDNILSKGNTDHPMTLFKNFRGREPKIDALLIKGGLVDTKEKV